MDAKGVLIGLALGFAGACIAFALVSRNKLPLQNRIIAGSKA